MTITAREAMQALLDGRAVYRRDGNDSKYIHTYKLSDEGKIVEWCDDKWWGLYTELNKMEGIVDEYPLDFEQALRAMLDGKTVMRKSSDEHRYRIRNGTFESSTERGDFTDWESCTIFANTQKAKWKVVE